MSMQMLQKPDEKPAEADGQSVGAGRLQATPQLVTGATETNRQTQIYTSFKNPDGFWQAVLGDNGKEVFFGYAGVGYDDARNGHKHNAFDGDVAGLKASEVRVNVGYDGTVIHITDESKPFGGQELGGRAVWIKSMLQLPDGTEKEFVTLYGHVDNLEVKVGDRVFEGKTAIGTFFDIPQKKDEPEDMGDHLHVQFFWWENDAKGAFFDPSTFEMGEDKYAKTTKESPEAEQIRAKVERVIDIVEAAKKGPVMYGTLDEFEQAVFDYLVLRHRRYNKALEGIEDLRKVSNYTAKLVLLYFGFRWAKGIDVAAKTTVGKEVERVIDNTFDYARARIQERMEDTDTERVWKQYEAHMKRQEAEAATSSKMMAVPKKVND
ncbi:MAG TPA: hypothetical protein VJH24_05940 [Candidatus Bilamarchaeaceae archaeon]|nr:hypothetical protein [Candidatus Bilamarchaeaceae archaeon]